MYIEENKKRLKLQNDECKLVPMIIYIFFWFILACYEVLEAELKNSVLIFYNIIYIINNILMCCDSFRELLCSQTKKLTHLHTHKQTNVQRDKASIFWFRFLIFLSKKRKSYFVFLNKISHSYIMMQN